MSRVLVLTAILTALSMSASGAEPDRIRKVRFPSADGFQLSARHYDPGKRGPAVLLFHQCDRKGPDTGLEALASALLRRGFHVLLPDARGFGESRDDRYRDFHTQMDLIEPRVGEDMKATFDFLLSLENVDRQRIALGGASCGARRVIRMIEAGQATAAALVLISGALRVDDASFSRARGIPTYAVFAEDDPFRAPAAMREVFAMSASAWSKLVAYKGSGHGSPLFEQDERLADDITAWLVERVAKTFSATGARARSR